MKIKSMWSPALSVALLALFLIGAIALAGVGGCTSKSTLPGVSTTPSPSPSPIGTQSPTPTPTPTTMNNVSVSYQASPASNLTYGPVDGYGLMSGPPVVATSSPVAPTAAPQGVVAVTQGQTIVFFNFDKLQRTVSLLGPANGMNWPSVFNNPMCAGCSSPAGSAITVTGFQASIAPQAGLIPGSSLGYVTGATTGSFYYGDWTNYLASPQMRTVITINP
jgi:hypothetical protein